MIAAAMNSSRTGPAARRDRVEREAAERQRDELDPARDDDGRGAAHRRRRVLARRPAAGGGRSSCPSVRSSAPCARVCAVPDAPATILFVGDLVGGLGRRTLLGLLPGAARAPRADVRRRQRRERRRRARDHAEDRRRAARRRRRRHHARQPRLPPPGDLPVPRRRASGSCARRTTCARSRATATPSSSATACASASSTSRATSTCAPGARRSPRSTPSSSRLDGKVDHVLVDMHAEATSEKVGLGWYLDGRVTAVVGTHTHVPDRRRCACCRAAPPTSPTSA